MQSFRCCLFEKIVRCLFHDGGSYLFTVKRLYVKGIVGCDDKGLISDKELTVSSGKQVLVDNITNAQVQVAGMTDGLALMADNIGEQVKVSGASFQETNNVARESTPSITGEQIQTKKFATLGVMPIKNNDNQSLQEGYYCCGHRNFCTVDGIYEPLTGEESLEPSCFEVTVSNEHSINLVGIANLLQQMENVPIVDYYFVVPKRSVCKFKCKRFEFNEIPKDCNERYPYLPENVNKSFCEARYSRRQAAYVGG